MASFCVAITRMTLGFWVGGAILFVLTSVAEQKHPQFDSLIRDQLATIRFPYYYVFGCCCLGTAVAGSAVAAVLNRGCLRKRMFAALVFVSLSSVVAAVDYTQVYVPLQQLITPPGKPRAEPMFSTLHNRSRWINEVHLSLALIAAVIVCWPEKRPDSTSPPACH